MASLTSPAGNEFQALVNGFDQDPVAYRALLDRQISEHPEKFYGDAIEVLKQGMDSRGAKYVIALMLASDLLMHAVSDPSLDRKLARRIMAAALHIDPATDVKLLRSIAGSIDTGGDDLPRGGVGRLLDVLGDVSPVKRLVPSLARLFRHPDPFVRSKAVLMVGRANRSARWTVQRLSDPDTRIRASAVEGLWGADSDDVRDVLRAAAADPNNRVAGNALLGLYRLGEVSTILEIQKMAADPSMLFRATAAWVMGETESMRFQECLAGMLRDETPMVRKRAFAALRKIKDAAIAPLASQWHVAARVSGNDPVRGTRRVLVAVMPEGKQQPAVLGTQLLLTDNGKVVHSYKVSDRALPDSVPVVFLSPRSAEPGDSVWLEGALRCMKLKRSTDFWASEQFLSDGPCEAMPSAYAPAFHSNLKAAENALGRQPQKSECADIWHSLWRVMQGEASGVRGRRHVILINLSQSRGAPGVELPAMLRMHGSLQVISTVPDPTLKNFCAKVHSTFEVAPSEDQLTEMIATAYLRLLGRYEISYSPDTPAPEDIRIRVQHPAGGGEAVAIAPPVAGEPR